MSESVFEFPVRVYYEDTDAGQVVYHSNYLNFMERARTEWLRDLGYEQDHLRDELGILFVVRAINIQYLKPAKFNQQLCVTSMVTEKGKSQFICHQDVFLVEQEQRDLLTTADVSIVCVSADRFKPTRIPMSIIDKL
ncbi:MAG: 4-hydroxybenzoyl-CoA thioesterase family active site [uncultured Thiotrichaceae bacterium]|uniref:4-hydroxybenzoyl-CoA thioesterase family active site n=1 Tax=uncultured Thiotrichaceae bacterium TaxID=298394 RepID=A0A6S6TXL6_9GAMM|nr:MAG: 4-hydroxybenzoyl-CoA thioesterase family active site [uncultured Thiotrichaceae bacterium]